MGVHSVHHYLKLCHFFSVFDLSNRRWIGEVILRYMVSIHNYKAYIILNHINIIGNVPYEVKGWSSRISMHPHIHDIENIAEWNHPFYFLLFLTLVTIANKIIHGQWSLLKPFFSVIFLIHLSWSFQLQNASLCYSGLI